MKYNFYCYFSALQLIDYPYGNGLEVILGGGWQSFLKCGSTTPDGNVINNTKCRMDGQDLTQVWRDRFDRSSYVWNKTQLNDIDPESVDHLLGKYFADNPG